MVSKSREETLRLVFRPSIGNQLCGGSCRRQIDARSSERLHADLLPPLLRLPPINESSLTFGRSLALPEPWFGFTIKERKVTLFDDGKTPINTSTWDQCGRTLAKLLSLPVSGASPCVEDWKNKSVYMSSFRVSQRDMLDSLHRVLGTTDADWTITHEGSVERYQRGMAELQAGNQMGFATAMYSRIFFQNGDGDFESMWGLANEKLGLPKEDLDTITKRAVDMAEGDFFMNTFGEAGPRKES